MIVTGPRNTEWNIDRKRLNQIGSRYSKNAGSRGIGLTAQAIVAEHYGVANSSSGEFDGLDRDRDTVYEVKSAQTEVYTGKGSYKAEGRFQIFKNQLDVHRSRENREGSTSWFVFVLFNDKGDLLDRRRMYPSTVERILEEGDYSATGGHSSGPRYKLPVSEVFDYVDES